MAHSLNLCCRRLRERICFTANSAVRCCLRNQDQGQRFCERGRVGAVPGTIFGGAVCTIWVKFSHHSKLCRSVLTVDEHDTPFIEGGTMERCGIVVRCACVRVSQHLRQFGTCTLPLIQSGQISTT